MLGHRGNPGLKGRLVEKSIEAYILALETINCLSVKYRVETFSYLLCNAWELLLKAQIIETAGNRREVYYRQKRDEKKRSLSLRDCLSRVFPNEKDPMRVNVEKIADLRDEACHLIISKVPKEVLALFQSSVLNYHKKLKDWFGIALSDRVSVGMMTIVYDLDPQEFDLENPRLRKELGKDAADYLLRYQAELRQAYTSLGKSPDFSIDIDYKLAFTKKTTNADVTLFSGGDGRPTHIVEVPKDPGKTHPYRQRDVLHQVNEKIKPARVNTYDLQCVSRKHGIEKRPDFFHQTSVTGSPKQYSTAYVDWLIEKHSADAQFFTKARERATQQMSERVA